MFRNPRYVTRGVADTVPVSTQMLLWKFIDNMDVETKDYLQVFTLSAENGIQKITHTQEQPDYCMEHCIPSEIPITAKIFVIDDHTHSTMLFAEEY